MPHAFLFQIEMFPNSETVRIVDRPAAGRKMEGAGESVIGAESISDITD